MLLLPGPNHSFRCGKSNPFGGKLERRRFQCHQPAPNLNEEIMKITNLIMLLTLVAASLAYSTATQSAQAAKEKTAKTAEAVDISKVPLQKGTHEVYRDKESGLVFFRTIQEE